MPWRRKQQPALASLPEKSLGLRSLAAYVHTVGRRMTTFLPSSSLMTETFLFLHNTWGYLKNKVRFHTCLEYLETISLVLFFLFFQIGRNRQRIKSNSTTMSINPSRYQKEKLFLKFAEHFMLYAACRHLPKFFTSVIVSDSHNTRVWARKDYSHFTDEDSEGQRGYLIQLSKTRFRN